MHEIEVQRKVVCFLQPIFTDELKREEAGDKRFSLTVFDDCDALHVGFSTILNLIKPDPKREWHSRSLRSKCV